MFCGKRVGGWRGSERYMVAKRSTVPQVIMIQNESYLPQLFCKYQILNNDVCKLIKSIRYSFKKIIIFSIWQLWNWSICRISFSADYLVVSQLGRCLCMPIYSPGGGCWRKSQRFHSWSKDICWDGWRTPHLQVSYCRILFYLTLLYGANNHIKTK